MYKLILRSLGNKAKALFYYSPPRAQNTTLEPSFTAKEK